MTDDQHGEGTPQGGSRWDPLPQGDYDDGATAFVKLPEGGIDALLASADSPLAAPGHGYVPPQITVNPAGADPSATGGWPAPAEAVQWPDPNAVPQDTGNDRFTYNPGATGQWNFETVEGSAGSAAEHTAAAPGHDVTGQWSIPVAGGDLPDESGEFTSSSLVEQWGGGTPPATLPGGAPAPWATEAAGQPWAQDAANTAAPADAAVDAPGQTHGEVSAQAYTRPHPGTPAQQHGGAPARPHAEGPGERAAQPHPDARPQQHPEVHASQHPEVHTSQHSEDRPPQHPGAPAQPHADAHGEAAAQHAQAHAPQHGEAPVRPASDGAHAQQPADGTAVADSPNAHETNALETAVAAPQPAQRAREAAEVSEGAQGAGEAAEGAVERSAEPERGPEPQSRADTEAGAESPGSETPDEAPTPPGDEHPLASYVLRVNGVDRPVTDAWIGESLLYVLRERLGLAGAKDGCSQGECGACNVQVDGRLVASCLVPGVTAAGSEVRTVEGLAEDGHPSDVQRALARCGAVQCGFCVPGMAMTVHDLLEGNPAPTELEARQALCGNLCRCSGYRGVLDAVKEVVGERESHRAADAETDADEARIPHQAGPGAGGVNPSAFEPHDQAYGQDGGPA
ncbi:2Fe-2S iron-sulfur cluster-binding protein [Streptomyces sp. DG2A-72]|uniref:2Fe-2S iron-sulfur cluster-binding protein n=1 Tax=Streptomyces sp. DG2A-72 TaxID=3051386 RepID=UPI00265BA49D|nr:2Fe-2S iron-sulfur cluster-binding protein [Streptomyces sp. DG2A-72]MDO0933547.1 2Fe-2S iron-sulfur cluster-binding protein [Streptomyces sp. DG2A-72]